jgi:murein DD-endopeptidase MepM/ murein hydrolase activator NlpD
VAFGVAPATVLGTAGALAQDGELQEAREQLRETRAKIRARSQRMNAVQRDLNRLATAMAENEEVIHESEERLGELDGRLDLLEGRTERLQERLNLRNREAYIQGPGAPVLFVLTATSAAEAAARMSLLSEMNRRDAVLAALVEHTRERLSRLRSEQARLQRAREFALQQLEIQRAELVERLEQLEWLFQKLQRQKESILVTISKYRPFAVCPLAGPHAISDSFGIWVHRSKERGGDHVHQGVDIMAAAGTPVVAPFDGTAVTAANKLGGLAVKVFGDYGYVYNAHLLRYGRLGPVEKGDVIGYVGATGNALGPHDHFEWHPGNGAAVDPYDFLSKVC